MIALLSFRSHFSLGVECFFVGKRYPVVSAKKRILCVAAPIGPSHAGQFESGTSIASVLRVRPTAEIEPVALAVNRDGFAFRDSIQQGKLPGVTGFFKKCVAA